MGLRVAVVGATGAVGLEMLKVLERRAFPVDSLRLFASPRSAGKRLRFLGDDCPVEPLSERSFEGIDLALFSAGASISREFAWQAARAGALVVDNSSAFRMDPQVPLVVPEINAPAAAANRGIIANPNCTTIVALLAVAPLHRAARVERFTAASYQAASGAGARGMRELEEQARAHVECRPVEPRVFPHRLAFNLFPHVDVFLENGYTKEEMKIVNETRKILGDEAIRVSATCVRVPVLRAHSVALHLETGRKVGVAEAREILSRAPGVLVEDDPARSRYPMPWEVAGRDEVCVGRIREDISHERGLALWVVGDQLLKGAALNAVQVAEVALGLEKGG
jgi:aspartate-semialdehyde dehydrogenase